MTSGRILVGHHHHQAVGQGHEAAVFADEGDAQVVVRADDVVAQRPSSRMSSRAAGLAERKLSGPASRVQPSTCSVWITPPRRGRDSMMVEGTPALRQVVGGGEAGDAAADDDYARHRSATSARAAVNVGEPFRDSGRRMVMPRSAAYSRKPMSMSHRISTWSQTKPMRGSRRRGCPRRRIDRESIRRSGRATCRRSCPGSGRRNRRSRVRRARRRPRRWRGTRVHTGRRWPAPSRAGCGR